MAGETRYAQLDLSNAIGRLGVAYVRKVCAHAHIGFDETSPGEDTLALDGQIQFDIAPVRVQVKATTRYVLAGGNRYLNFPVEAEWVDKWAAQVNPTFLVVVLLARPIPEWVKYDDSETRLQAMAMWARIDGTPVGTQHIALDRQRRFDVMTIGEWGDLLYAQYGRPVRTP